MFVPLPSGFFKLSEAVESLGKFTLSAPPEVEDLACRMRKLYAKARADGYKGLSGGAIRRLPYAMWMDGEPPLHELEPDLVRAYWTTHLPAAIAQPRPAKRWLTPLFFTYCHGFRRERADFQDFAQRLRLALTLAQGPFAQWMRDLQAHHRWFVPDDVGSQLGKKLATDLDSLASVVQRLNLWSGFLETRIASEAFAGALRSPNEVLAREPVIQRVKSWSRSNVGGKPGQSMFKYPEHRVLLADGLVRPWLRQPPPDNIRNSLIAYLIKHYGDPRILTSVHQGHHWQGVSDETISTVKRWLVGDTLHRFMKILEITADEIWRYRQKFWMAYYERGVVDEAWLALGTHAAWRANKELGKTDWMQYGLLTAGAASDQSVLFMRIGHVVFMEWSHNGSLRALTHDDPQLPQMYQQEYSGTELRLVRSMDFHGGVNQQPQLSHFNSEGGTWQRKARDFIAKHTGVKLNDQAIIG